MIHKVPEGWKRIKMGDVGDLSAGGTPSTNMPSFWENGTIRWMTSGEVHQKRVFEVANRITEEGYKNSSAKLLPKKTILIALAGQGKTRGTVAISEIELTTNQSIGAVQLNQSVADPTFVFYNLDARYQELRRLSLGDGRAGLNLDILRKLELCLPPVAEQKKISEILSAWDRAIETLEKLIETKTHLKKGLMQKLLANGRGKPCRIADVAKIVVSNVDKKTHSDQRRVSLCNYLDVYKNAYITGDLPFMQATASDQEIKKFSLHEGDVLITKDSETPLDIGIPAVVAEKLHNVICGYHLAIIRPDNGKVDPIYLSKAIQTLNAKKQFYKYANGATRFGLAVGDIGKIEFSAPKIDEQIKIAKLLKAVDNDVILLARLSEFLKRQKQGLMQKLLTGKIRVHA